jgi:ribosomal protein S18 acetylase RimI-like enzyme
METLTYRQGNLNDLQQLKSLGINSYSQYSEILSGENWIKFHNSLQDEEELAELISKATVFVCEINNLIIGMVCFISSGNPTEIFQHDWCYLRRLGVNQSFRGKGIAKKLTQLCITYAKETNENTIALHTSEIMNHARSMYESIGFKQIKEINNLFGKRYWLYSMQL